MPRVTVAVNLSPGRRVAVHTGLLVLMPTCEPELMMPAAGAWAGAGGLRDGDRLLGRRLGSAHDGRGWLLPARTGTRSGRVDARRLRPRARRTLGAAGGGSSADWGVVEDSWSGGASALRHRKILRERGVGGGRRGLVAAGSEGGER